MEYVTWLFLFVWLPSALLWVLNGSYLARYKKTFLYCVILAMLFSVPWDLWAVHMNIWYFPTGANLGVKVFILPVEEYLFMFSVTFFISTIILLIRRKVEKTS